MRLAVGVDNKATASFGFRVSKRLLLEGVTPAPPLAAEVGRTPPLHSNEDAVFESDSVVE